MTALSSLRGHAIYWDGEQWRYRDNDQPTIEGHDTRPCGHCGLQRTREGHDACLGTLPGVANACCGHGEQNEAYIQYEDGRHISGEEAVVEFVRLIGDKESYYTNEANL